MIRILQRMGRSTRFFTPRTVNEFFALQLSRKLGDEAGVSLYLRLAEQHSPEFLIRIYRRSVKRRQGQENLASLFEEELKNHPGGEDL